MQGALAKAVRHGYLDAVERAGEAMKEHSVKLDFCISEDTKVSSQHVLVTINIAGY